ncbi:MAG TPA: DUF2269 family protein [Candidatus Avamphibacillus intestinigallinarum]|nr:DUF2269 family protein [Candidatus Avamphibacillus intestinigallinarum]
MTLYQLLLIIHILSAIIGLGPGFVMIYLVTYAQTMEQLRYSYQLRHRIHIFVMIGGVGILVTGIWMGLLNPVLLSQGWYLLSLMLYLIALAMGPVVLKRLSAPIKHFLSKPAEYEGIPQSYKQMANKLFFYERIEMIIFIMIIILMVWKPF